MSNNMVFYAIFGVIALVLIGIAAYFAARFLKGNIKLYLEKKGFNFGECIKGNFRLNTKKEMMGNTLTVALIGKKHIRYHEKSESDTKDTTIEIYNNQVMIEQGKVYPAGYSEVYNFEIPLPDAPKDSSKENDISNSPVFQMASSAMEFMSSKSISYTWAVEVRLDLDGVDIATSQKVFVNI